MSNCTPVIFSAVYAFFEERGATDRFNALVSNRVRNGDVETHVEVRVLLGTGGEYARVVYLVLDKDPSTYEVTVAYSIQDLPESGIGMSRDRARVFHADVALVEKMLAFVDERVEKRVAA